MYTRRQKNGVIRRIQLILQNIRNFNANSLITYKPSSLIYIFNFWWCYHLSPPPQQSFWAYFVPIWRGESLGYLESRITPFFLLSGVLAGLGLGGRVMALFLGENEIIDYSFNLLLVLYQLYWWCPIHVLSFLAEHKKKTD